MKLSDKSNHSDASSAKATNELTAASINLMVLPDEVWTRLLKDAEEFAGKLIKRYHWRGAKGGVLPGGFDASSIAAQAVTELFQPVEASSGQTAVDQTFLDDGPDGLVMPGPIKTGVP